MSSSLELLNHPYILDDVLAFHHTAGFCWLIFYLAFLLQASVLSGSLGLGIGAPVVKRWSCLPHSLEEVVSMAAINATGGDPDPDCGEDRGGKRVTAKECECEIQSAVLSLAPLLADG